MITLKELVQSPKLVKHFTSLQPYNGFLPKIQILFFLTLLCALRTHTLYTYTHSEYKTYVLLPPPSYHSLLLFSFLRTVFVPINFPLLSLYKSSEVVNRKHRVHFLFFFHLFLISLLCSQKKDYNFAFTTPF